MGNGMQSQSAGGGGAWVARRGARREREIADRKPTVDRATILLCGPPLTAVGGGPTHLRNMLASPLGRQYTLVHFETGSRGSESPAKDERAWSTLSRLVVSPFVLTYRLLRLRPAVVHINSSLVPKAFWRDCAYVFISRWLGYKSVVQFHGGSIDLVIRGQWSARMAQRMFNTADALVVLGNVAKSEFERLGIADRVTVIPNCVDVAQYRGAGMRAHSGRLRRLVYLGRLDRDKGLTEAIEAMAALRDVHGITDIELSIAGSGDVREQLESRVQALRLRDSVHFVGPLYGAEKARFLREADAFLLPSYYEGLPYAVLESLAAGTPVITTRVGDIPDVVIDRVHGLLIEPRSTDAIVRAIVELRESPQVLRQMSSNCVAWASERLGLERLAHQFAELYRRLSTKRVI